MKEDDISHKGSMASKTIANRREKSQHEEAMSQSCDKTAHPKNTIDKNEKKLLEN